MTKKKKNPHTPSSRPLSIHFNAQPRHARWKDFNLPRYWEINRWNAKNHSKCSKSRLAQSDLWRRFWIISQVWLMQSYFHALRVENAPSLAGSKKSQQPVMHFSIFVKIKKTELEKPKLYKQQQLALALTSWKQKHLKWRADELEAPSQMWLHRAGSLFFCYINWLINRLVVCREVCMHMEVIIWVLGGQDQFIRLGSKLLFWSNQLVGLCCHC